MQPFLAWKYKLEVHVTGFSTTKDFLANITLLYRPGMRADFRDIRASTKTGAKIPLFIESIVEFNQAFIWFKLPQNTDFFYLHYGNGGATSESDGKKVFTFFDHFEKLDSTVWRLIAGSATVSKSILTLQNTSQSSVLESYSTFSPNTVVEIRAQYNAGNRTIFGYRSYSSQKAAAWQSSAAGDANNQRFAHNGSTGNWDSDGVNRAGSAYYVYGVAHIVAGPLYYVNYTYRGTIADYIPGNVSLPVQFYCYSNTGPFRVDWVRVRDYDETLPTLTIGRKFTTQPKGFPWDNAITEANTRMGMYPSVNIKSFLKNINTKLGMKASVMFRRPLFYNPQLLSPYPKWKYAGEINFPNTEGTDVKDLSGNGKHLSIFGAPTKTENGFIFNVVGDYLSRAPLTAINITADFEVNLKAVLFSTAGIQRIIYNNNTTTDRVTFNVNAGSLYLGFYNGSAYSNIRKFVFPPELLNTVVDIKFGKAAGVSFLTVNGVNSVSHPGSGPNTGGAPILRVGGDTEQFINGKIIEVIFKDASSQILAHYKPGRKPTRIKLPILPGMGLDGRDLRYTDLYDKDIRHNIFATGSDFLDCWVEVSEWDNRVKFYYGNGIATTKSDSSLVGTVDSETTVTVTPNIGGGGGVWMLPGWKYQGEINLSGTSSATGGEQILLSIPLLPGMTVDGRDLRFLDRDGNKLSHYLESSDASGFSVWVKLPALHDKIFLLYGNGLAVSESSASGTFDIWDDFEGSTLGPEWALEGGSVSVSNSTIILGSTERNSLIRGSSVFGPGHIVEMRMYHPNQNQTICGFWSGTNQRACWVGASGSNYNDHTHTHNGSTSTMVDDGINRGGTTYYIYGINYESGNIGFYVDGLFRRTMTVTTPSESIPISFYSTTNKGDLVVDWVRVRKITNISGTLGKLTRKTGAIYYETTTETSIEIIPEIQLSHRPQWKTPQIYYEYIKLPSSFMGMVPGEPTFKKRRELGDYAIVSCEVNRSINDAYIQLFTEFQNLTVPPEGSTIKHNAYDSHGNPHLLFHGKILTNSPTHGHYSQTVKMHAADNSINLVTQPVPWVYQVIDTAVDTVPNWLVRILEPEKSGVYPKTLIDTNKEPKQFVFDPKTKKLEAIKELAKYAGCLYQTRLITREIDGTPIIRPEFYFVPPERIDEPVNGFDLPAPLELNVDDCKLASDPQVTNESEEKYNSVLVYGVLSENGETVVAQAFSYEVYTGEQKPKVYIIEDNAITEKGSTAEREAIKWLLYFLSKRVKVTMSFVDRFDFELYQRIRFGPEFSDKLQGLTQSQQVKFVAANDPRDAENSTHLVDVSGVPRPRWLRISEIKHISEHKLEIVSVTAITDNIYSVVDPIVPAPWSDYLSPGYYKPIIDDLVDTTQSIVEDNIAKQLTPESCTVLSINTEDKTAVVQTASGKIVTVSLA